MCLIQRTKTRTNLRFLFKEVVHHVKVFIKRKVSVIRHISSPITSLQHSQMYYTGNILQTWSSIWCFFSPCYLMSFSLHEVCNEQTTDQQHPARKANQRTLSGYNITKVNVKGCISVSQCCSIPRHILLEPLTEVHTSER